MYRRRGWSVRMRKEHSLPEVPSSSKPNIIISPQRIFFLLTRRQIPPMQMQKTGFLKAELCNLAVNTTNATSKCSAARAGVGILADFVTMTWKTIHFQERRPKTCCACCATLRRLHLRRATCAEIKLLATTAPFASSGIMIQRRRFTTAMIVASADSDRVWGKTFSIARPVSSVCRLPLSGRTDALNNQRSAIAQYVVNTSSPHQRRWSR